MTLQKLSTFFVAALLSSTLVACASKETKDDAPPVQAPPTGADESEPVIDTLGIQRALRLEIPTNDLGYREAGFNTCQMGYGYSSSQNCTRQTMSVVNFRLQCRDSEGTVSEAVGASNLRAISGSVRFTLGGKSGVTTTDGEGYGQIVSIAAKSPKTSRLRLAYGNQFLYMRANEVTRVVVPKAWCE